MWQQVYDPLHSSALSALVAAVPIIFFLLGLTVLKLSGIKSAVISLALALVIGCAIFGMPITAGAGSILHLYRPAHPDAVDRILLRRLP